MVCAKDATSVQGLHRGSQLFDRVAWARGPKVPVSFKGLLTFRIGLMNSGLSGVKAPVGLACM